MDIFEYYTIPIKGLHNGVHQFDFEVDDEFFLKFEDSMLDNGAFNIKLNIEKKYDHSEMLFEIKGFTKTACDRCLAEINLPITSSHKLYLKLIDDETEISDDDEDIIYFHRSDSTLNLAQQIYEFIVLSVPAIKRYNCEDDELPPCDFEVLKKIGSEKPEIKKASIWDSLKDLDLNDN
jgi:uncharacterized metal-binding protein YceD (DUF177 family)